MTTNNNELIPMNAGYLALKEFDPTALMADECAGLNISFERVKIPAGGGTVFEIAGDDPGNSDSVKEFSAVILYNHPLFAYYKDKYEGGSNPPDCGSYDGVTGVGTPGGNCARCPYNQFGSGVNNAKACKNRRRMFLLREGELFPLILSLPTGSLKDYTRYVTRLMSKGHKPSGVVTRFSLKRATNKNGIVYSQAQFAMDRKLTAEEAALVSSFAEKIKEMSRSVAYEVDEEPLVNVDTATGEIVEPLA